VLDPEVDDWARRVQDFGREVESADLRRNRVRIEDKGAILAFHWRGAHDEDAARAAVDAVAARAEAAGFRTHWGRKVLEVRPPVAIDKGSGISALLDGAEIDSALFVGDDRTDLDAFRALAKMAADGRIRHAVRVAVRSDEGPTELTSEADFVVEGTPGVSELLEMLTT
jgi:trehalose 6-phosphate phosphatase